MEAKCLNFESVIMDFGAVVPDVPRHHTHNFISTICIFEVLSSYNSRIQLRHCPYDAESQQGRVEAAK